MVGVRRNNVKSRCPAIISIIARVPKAAKMYFQAATVIMRERKFLFLNRCAASNYFFEVVLNII